jgi:hypothetical protein
MVTQPTDLKRGLKRLAEQRIEKKKSTWHVDLSFTDAAEIRDQDNFLVAKYPRSTDSKDAHENEKYARETVAFHNVCQGINPEAIPELINAAKTLNTMHRHEQVKNGDCICPCSLCVALIKAKS